MKQIFITTLFTLLSMLMFGQTDVDTRIAVNDQKDPNTFVLVISNENYKYEQPVPFALNDGSIFKLYCEKTLGIPSKNIRYAPDATLNDMRMQLMWLEKVMKAFQGDARAIVYYSGHGMPSEEGKHAYLLPVDGNSQLAGSGLSTESLYKQLGQMPSKGTIVLLDACFSGARRDGKMLASNRGVAIKVKDEPITGKMVVFSAAQGDETAYPYQEQRHGLFTYYVLSALQEKRGAISLGDLSDQVTKMVARTSIVENDKSQTPTIHSSSASTNWRNWMFASKAASRTEIIVQTSKPIISKPDDAINTTDNTTSNVASKAPQTTTTPTVKTFTVDNVSFNMIYVDGGSFQMGATSEQDDAYKDEKPVHQVTVSPYYIGETEVTQVLWKAVMGNNPSTHKGDNLPVEKVSWNDCQEFILKLNQMAGSKFRLPTEAEWEFAARGGSKSRGYKYSGSNSINNVAWIDDNSSNLTHAVKTKQANELGLYDMSGNVWEWCQDWKGKYSNSSLTNPSGPSSGSRRMRRGGSALNPALGCRISSRASTAPNHPAAYIGLRLVLSEGNQISDQDISVPQRTITEILGGEFRVITVSAKEQLNIEYGIEITKINSGKLKYAGVSKGFIIQEINDKTIQSIEDMKNIILETSTSKDPVLYIKGMYPTGKKGLFAVSL